MKCVLISGMYPNIILACLTLRILPNVHLVVFLGCADLHLLDMLSPMERKRQGYIHELIVTEENYVNDLQLVTEVGKRGPYLSLSLSLCLDLYMHLFIMMCIYIVYM